MCNIATYFPWILPFEVDMNTNQDFVTKTCPSFDNLFRMKWKKKDQSNNMENSSTVSSTTDTHSIVCNSNNTKNILPVSSVDTYEIDPNYIDIQSDYQDFDYMENIKKHELVFLIHESHFDNWIPNCKSNHSSKEKPFFRNIHPSGNQASFFYLDPEKELAKMSHCSSANAVIESSLDPNVPAFKPLSTDNIPDVNSVSSLQTVLYPNEASVAVAAPKRRPGICMNRKPIQIERDIEEPALSSNMMHIDQKSDIDKLLDQMDAVRLDNLTRFRMETPIQKTEIVNPLEVIFLNNLTKADQESNLQECSFILSESETRGKDVCFPSSAISTIPTAMVQPSVITVAKTISEQVGFHSSTPLKSMLHAYSTAGRQEIQVPQLHSIPNQSQLLPMEQGQQYHRPTQVYQSASSQQNHFQPPVSNPNQMISMELEPQYQHFPKLPLASGQEKHCEPPSVSNQNQMFPMEQEQKYQHTPRVLLTPGQRNHFEPSSVSNENQMLSIEQERQHQHPPQSLLMSGQQNHVESPFVPNQNQMLSMELEQQYQQPSQVYQFAFQQQNKTQPPSACNRNQMHMVGQGVQFQQPPPGYQMAVQPPKYSQQSAVPDQNQMLKMEQDHLFQHQPPTCKLFSTLSVPGIQDRSPSPPYMSQSPVTVNQNMVPDEYCKQINSFITDDSEPVVTLYQLGQLIASQSVDKTTISNPPIRKNHTGKMQESHHVPEISFSSWNSSQSIEMPEQNLCSGMRGRNKMYDIKENLENEFARQRYEYGTNLSIINSDDLGLKPCPTRGILKNRNDSMSKENIEFNPSRISKLNPVRDGKKVSFDVIP